MTKIEIAIGSIIIKIEMAKIEADIPSMSAIAKAIAIENMSAKIQIAIQIGAIQAIIKHATIHLAAGITPIIGRGNHMVPPIIGTIHQIQGGVAIINQIIPVHTIIITITRGLTLDPTLETTLWDHMVIGIGGMIAGVMPIYGHAAGVLTDTIHIEVGIAIIFGIHTQANGVAGAAGSHFS